MCWLFGPASPNVADNGDYWRVARPAGIDSPAGTRTGSWTPTLEYPVAKPSVAAGLSSPAVLAWCARTIGARGGTLDIRWMGAICTTLLCLAAAFAVRAGVATLAITVPLVVVLDTAYLPFFNSFYAESTFLPAWIGVLWWTWLGFAPQTRRGPSWLAAGLGLLLLGGLAKQLYSPLGLVVLGVLVGIGAMRSQSLPRAALLVLTAASVACPLWFGLGGGPTFATVNRYHATFGGVAALSDDPTAVLDRLGVPPAYRDLPRTDVFRAGIANDHPVHRALAEVSVAEIAAEYLRDPTLAVRAVDRVVHELAAAKSHTRAIEVGGPKRSYRMRPTDLSYWRASLVSQRPRFAALVASAVVILGAWAAWRRRADSLLAVILLSAAWALVQSTGAILGDGVVSLRQHLLAARFAVDVAVLFGLLGLGTAGAAWLRSRGGGGLLRPPRPTAATPPRP